MAAGWVSSKARTKIKAAGCCGAAACASNRILRSMVMVLMIVTVCIDKRLGGGFAPRTGAAVERFWIWRMAVARRASFHGAKGYSATRLGGH